jgi:hypothetical protein
MGNRFFMRCGARHRNLISIITDYTLYNRENEQRAIVKTSRVLSMWRIVAGFGGDFLEEIPPHSDVIGLFISNGTESACIAEAAGISDHRFQIQGI